MRFAGSRITLTALRAFRKRPKTTVLQSNCVVTNPAPVVTDFDVKTISAAYSQGSIV